MNLYLAVTALLLLVATTPSCSAYSDDRERRGLRRSDIHDAHDQNDANRSLGKKKDEEEEELHPILVFMKKYESSEMSAAQDYFKQAEMVQKSLDKDNKLYEERRKNLKEELGILKDKEKELEDELKDLPNLIKNAESDLEHAYEDLEKIREKIKIEEEKKGKELKAKDKMFVQEKEDENEVKNAKKTLEKYLARLEAAMVELKLVKGDIVKLTFEYKPPKRG